MPRVNLKLQFSIGDLQVSLGPLLAYALSKIDVYPSSLCSILFMHKIKTKVVEQRSQMRGLLYPGPLTSVI